MRRVTVMLQLFAITINSFNYIEVYLYLRLKKSYFRRIALSRKEVME